MSRKGICLLLAVCCLQTLSGCSGRREEDRGPAPTLPPAKSQHIAPDQDEVIAEGGEYRIYLPGRDDLGLVSRSTRLDPADLNDTAEMLVRSLIEFPGDEETRKLGGNRALELYGDHPVEVSGGVCTVNLSTAALQLSLRDYYKNCLALSTTLCELKDINSVNVLTADQSVGLDITGNLPMGTLTAHPGENLSVLWEQMEAKRTTLGGISAKPR